MKHNSKFLILLLALFSSLQVRAQLADEEKDFLANRVRDNYEVFGITGAQVYRTQKHWTLVCIVTSAKLNKAKFNERQAQMDASRLAQEFLSGATNQSTSIYDAYSKEGGGEVDEETTMSDKIIQSSRSDLSAIGLQPICRFKSEEGETIFAYYIVICKQKAKRKI